MFKVLIWDYTGISAQWMEQVADMKDIEVVGTITPGSPAPEILLKRDAWDWLLIFEHNMREFFDVTLLALKLPLDKVIYALDMNSWIQRPKAAMTLTDWQRGGNNIFLNLYFSINRQLNNLVTCTVEGLHYVATSRDDYVMRPMYTTRQNHAANNMKNLQALAKKYYSVDESTGYFLDLGANIGTTGIYFTKKLAPNLKLLAFEPDAENFKLLRTNLILNDLADKATIVNCGLGDNIDEMIMYRDLVNPGHNNVTEPKENVPTETVKIIPLDMYLAENNIAAQSVKYIWIDTEGFEPQVLLGAKNLLLENPAPIFMECNLKVWNESGRFEEMLTLLEKSYSHLIHVAGNKMTLYPLEALQNVGNPNAGIGGNGDIFLIRKGSVVEK